MPPSRPSTTTHIWVENKNFFCDLNIDMIIMSVKCNNTEESINQEKGYNNVGILSTTP